jgi:hypothetical protein
MYKKIYELPFCFLETIWSRGFHSGTKKTAQNRKTKKENQSFFITTILFFFEYWEWEEVRRTSDLRFVKNSLVS